MSEINKVHHNIPQILFNIVRAHITVCFWGRGTGKTEGPGVDFTLYNAITMPQSLGGLISVSYDKLLTFILPKIIKGWERYGFIENTHFWVRKFAPPELKRPKPFLAPMDAKHFIHVCNGSGLQLISLDRLGISNAADLDYIYADECRLFDYEKFVEVLHTNRGNSEHFGHLSQHHSILLTTDRPQDSNGDWMYRIAENADPETLEILMMIQQRIFELKEEIENSRTKTAIQKKMKLIEDFENDLNTLRKSMVYVSEASTLDNVHALGTDVIRDLKRELTDIVFRISVLNERIRDVENGFYKDLDNRKHGYNAVNHHYLDTHDINYKSPDVDCRWYTDVIHDEPLDIAFDHNAAINNIVTGQGSTKEYRFVHSTYIKGQIQDLISKWDEYFRFHKHVCPVVNYYYDHTSVGGRADSDINYSDVVVNKLTELGWEVNRIYIGQQPGYKARFVLWEKLCNNLDQDYPTFRFNTTMSEYWYDVCKMTRSRPGGKEGFEKDKSDEKKKNFPQEQAPHITDAGDTLAVGAIHLKYKGSTEFLETGIY